MPGHTMLSISSKPILNAAIVASFVMFVLCNNQFPTDSRADFRHTISLISFLRLLGAADCPYIFASILY